MRIFGCPVRRNIMIVLKTGMLMAYRIQGAFSAFIQTGELFLLLQVAQVVVLKDIMSGVSVT